MVYIIKFIFKGKVIVDNWHPDCNKTLFFSTFFCWIKHMVKCSIAKIKKGTGKSIKFLFKIENFSFSAFLNYCTLIYELPLIYTLKTSSLNIFRRMFVQAENLMI